MNLIGERIIIRNFKLSDLDDYYEYGKDELVGPNAGWKPFESKDIAKRVLSSQLTSKETYAIVLKENDKLVGSISLYNNALRNYKKAKSLGFSLSSKYWNRGLMTEAVKMMIKYAFSKTDCDVLELGHHQDNYRCKSVAVKCGFNYDGTLCCYKKLYDGRLVDACFYSMKKEEFERMNENE